MSDVGLLYVGAVLFVNGLMLLGKVNAKSAGVFNLFVGGMQVITPFYLIFTSQGDQWLIFNASGIFLFGLTYLYVGITNLKDLDTTGLGWYSLWVAIMAIGYSLMNFIQFGDEKFGVIWLMWSFLWLLFFILLGLKKEISTFTGWVTVIQSWITATIPAFLSLIGLWNNINSTITWIITIITIVIFAIIYLKSRPQSENRKVGV